MIPKANVMGCFLKWSRNMQTFNTKGEVQIFTALHWSLNALFLKEKNIYHLLNRIINTNCYCVCLPQMVEYPLLSNKKNSKSTATQGIAEGCISAPSPRNIFREKSLLSCPSRIHNSIAYSDTSFAFLSAAFWRFIAQKSFSFREH